MNLRTRLAPAEPSGASDDIGARFAEAGYVVLPGLLDPSEVEALREEALAICRGQRGHIRGVELALNGETDDDVFRRYLCIHFPHKISPLARSTMCHPGIVSALRTIIGPNIKSMQSMLFIKADGKPGQAWHQDENFIPTRDRSLTAAWLALDDATVENGCLWVLPGSHRPGVVYPDREHDDDRFDCATEAFDFPYRDEDAVPVEVTAGSLVVSMATCSIGRCPTRAMGCAAHS